MIPRLGDGNKHFDMGFIHAHLCLENDSPSRGRKPGAVPLLVALPVPGLENDSPSRGRKRCSFCNIDIVNIV